MQTVQLVAHYSDHEEESRVSSADDPAGMFVAGHFLEVRWRSSSEACLNVEGREVRIPRGETAEFPFFGVRVRASHT